MFDAINIHSHHHIEKRAPTDDSIRLYDEIKEKAYNSLLMTISPGDNDLKAVGRYYRDYYNFDHNFRFYIKLNGKEVKGNVKVNEFDITDKSDLVITIYEQLGKEIAKQLLIKSLEN